LVRTAGERERVQYRGIVNTYYYYLEVVVAAEAAAA